MLLNSFSFFKLFFPSRVYCNWWSVCWSEINDHLSMRNVFTFNGLLQQNDFDDDGIDDDSLSVAASLFCGGVMFTILNSIYIIPYTHHHTSHHKMRFHRKYPTQFRKRERKEGKRAYLYKMEQKTKIGDPTRPQQYYHCTPPPSSSPPPLPLYLQLIIVNSNLRKREN